MEGGILVITILAMCLGYSLVRHLINAISGAGGRSRKNKRAATHPNHGMSLKDQEALQAKAKELMRRVETLEEIIASESETVESVR